MPAPGWTCPPRGRPGPRGGRNPVGPEAVHIRRHSRGGPDEPGNVVAPCAPHHALSDLGTLGLAPDLRIRVSPRCTARSREGHDPGPGRSAVDRAFVAWHGRQVFKPRSSGTAGPCPSERRTGRHGHR